MCRDAEDHLKQTYITRYIWATCVCLACSQFPLPLELRKLCFLRKDFISALLHLVFSAVPLRDTLIQGRFKREAATRNYHQKKKMSELVFCKESGQAARM